MSPDSTNALILQLFDNVSQQIQDSHTRLRADLTSELRELRSEVRQQNGRISANETRLTKIETQRESEEKQAVKKATWVAMLSAAIIQVMTKLVEAWQR